MDLISAEDKSLIHQMFDDIHDTFSRDIDLYVEEKSINIDTDKNHNPLYGLPRTDKKYKQVKKYTKKARIKYVSEQDRIWGAGTDSQLNLNFPRGLIRLKVDEDTYKLIVKSSKITLDDRLCELVSSPSRPGPFNPNYWTIYLKQLD